MDDVPDQGWTGSGEPGEPCEHIHDFLASDVPSIHKSSCLGGFGELHGQHLLYWSTKYVIYGLLIVQLSTCSPTAVTTVRRGMLEGMEGGNR